MNYSDETLMAFVDGEANPSVAAEIEHAQRLDPGLARRIAVHRNLRQRLQNAYAAELDEEVPERLLALLASPPSVSTASATGSPSIVSLEQARVDRAEPAERAEPANRARRPWSAPQWAAMAASLIVGLGAGFFAWQASGRGPISTRHGILVADAALSQTLSETLASENVPRARLRVGLSYQSKSGSLCRSFSDAALAGIACRDGEQWRIRLLTQASNASGQAGDSAAQVSDNGAAVEPAYRRASSSMPPVVLQAIDGDIVGDPLDARAESAARARGWRTQ